MRLLFVIAILSSLSYAQESVDAWAAVPAESRPSLAIRWSPRNADDWNSTPAAIRASTAIDLRVEAPADSTIRWFQIVPNTSRYYKNANHPWEPEAYKWVGFGKIEYLRRELTEFRDKPEIAITPSKAFAFDDSPRLYRSDLGSFWLTAEVLKDGKRVRSPGLAENTDRNLSPKVFRISVRKDDSYLGHLTTFFNVPGLFGSIPYQCNNYIGSDCADVLVSARRIWKNKPGNRDYNVSMLVSEWPKVTEFEITGGKPEEKISWGKDVRPGDLIAVRYAGRSRYQHIGALYGDEDESGTLSAADFVLHAGPEALHLTPLSRGSFDGTVAILRPPE